MSAAVMAQHTVAVLWAAAMDAADKDEVWGLHSLVEIAAEEIVAATTAMDQARAQNASSLLGQSAALGAIVLAQDDDGKMPLLAPALELLDQASRLLDVLIEGMAKAGRPSRALARRPQGAER
jgi:hypothetical protein